MKVKNILIAVAMFAVSVCASAQSKGWNQVSLQYNPMSMATDGHAWIFGGTMDDLNVNGFSAVYTRGISITPSQPLYFVPGLGVQYSNYDDDGDEVNVWSAKVPLSLLYRFEVTDSKIAFEPNLGFDLRYNISGDATLNGIDGDMFSDLDCSRFQFGWHIGMNITYDKYLFEFSYGTDLTKFHDKVDKKFSIVTVGLGYRF